MKLPKGVTKSKKKDNTIYYRSSLFLSGKHVSLGSYPNETEAFSAYKYGLYLLHSSFSLEEFLIKKEKTERPLPFDKCIMLLNYRDHNIYIKNPIYLMKSFFLYFLNEDTVCKFDIDDLFYYSTHKLQKRGGYFFVSDYGMQVNILSRYGIKNYGIVEKDYSFRNGDHLDFRYGNILLHNPYYGVSSITMNHKCYYRATIHINGNYIIGTYPTDIMAAIAYNKAIDILKKRGCKKAFMPNYILSLSAREYAEIYSQIHISKHISDLNFCLD